MYSVIIPTLWKSNRTSFLLKSLVDCSSVKEIILINNSNTIFNASFSTKKIKTINPKQNLYVNPSWNLGVETSTSDNIIICNDDINFDSNLYFYLLDQVDLLKTGFIGMSASNYNLESPLNPTIKKYESGTYGWGCLIAFHKSNWVPIPDELKIWCGDSFMIEVNPSPSNTLHGFHIKNWIQYLNNIRQK